MKAILRAGGKGTRLRPLTIHTPKPIVPIFDRPFLHYQLDLLKQVPEIDEVILSLNYQPRRIEEIFGDGGDSGLGIRYVVEPAPLATAGAVRYARESLPESVIATRRSSGMCTAATGSTSARRTNTCRCTATSWTDGIALLHFPARRRRCGSLRTRASKKA